MNQQTFLHTIMDFTNQRQSSKHESIDVQNKSRQSFNSLNFTSPQQQLQANSNEKLLIKFKQLRAQLQQSTKMCQIYKMKLTEKETEFVRLLENEKEYLTMNFQFKSELQKQKLVNQENKGKLQILKTKAKNIHLIEDQVQFLKMTVCDLKRKISDLQNEKNKVLEISIIQKVQLEEKINKFEAKKNTDLGYIQEMEIQTSKMRQKCIKLENELKKIQIAYDEEVYSKKWAHSNFEKQHLQQQLAHTNADNAELLSKHKKQKQKRTNLEKRVLELEQTSGLWIVKAETFEMENKALLKKCRKLQNKMQQICSQSDKKIGQVLCLEEKFAKSNSIVEQLISRAKRQVSGDLVSLAKSCEFKLNKLKDQKQTFFRNSENQGMPRKSTIERKVRSTSKKNVHKIQQKQKRLYTETKPIANLFQKFDQCPTKPETQPHSTINTQSNDEMQSYTRYTEPLGQIQNMQLRIQRERSEMQKKIREKMLYRKLEVADQSQKEQIRGDYFKLQSH